jgi:hypothetical protein
MTVFWMPEAIETFAQNLSYLKEEWSEDVVTNFIDKTEETISYIKANPLLYPSINKKKKIHKCIVVRQVSLYYKVHKDRIDLLTFWNNYQNPKKLKLK